MPLNVKVSAIIREFVNPRNGKFEKIVDTLKFEMTQKEVTFNKKLA